MNCIKLLGQKSIVLNVIDTIDSYIKGCSLIESNLFYIKCLRIPNFNVNLSPLAAISICHKSNYEHSSTC